MLAINKLGNLLRKTFISLLRKIVHDSQAPRASLWRGAEQWHAIFKAGSAAAINHNGPSPMVSRAKLNRVFLKHQRPAINSYYSLINLKDYMK